MTGVLDLLPFVVFSLLFGVLTRDIFPAKKSEPPKEEPKKVATVDLGNGITLQIEPKQ